jgi:hypothetical protein
VIASSYQAVSGAGAQGIIELDEQLKAIAAGREFETRVFARQIAYNVIPQVDAFTGNGYTKEEMKMQNEGRKILGAPELKVSCTCVRVPVQRSHSVAITAQFSRPVDPDAARAAFDGQPGIQVVDDLEKNEYPVPLDTTGRDDCLVGRIRSSLVLDNALDLWVVGDQVRKGPPSTRCRSRNYSDPWEEPGMDVTELKDLHRRPRGSWSTRRSTSGCPRHAARRPPSTRRCATPSSRAASACGRCSAWPRRKPAAAPRMRPCPPPARWR